MMFHDAVTEAEWRDEKDMEGFDLERDTVTVWLALCQTESDTESVIHTYVGDATTLPVGVTINSIVAVRLVAVALSEMLSTVTVRAPLVNVSVGETVASEVIDEDRLQENDGASRLLLMVRDVVPDAEADADGESLVVIDRCWLGLFETLVMVADLVDRSENESEGVMEALSLPLTVSVKSFVAEGGATTDKDAVGDRENEREALSSNEPEGVCVGPESVLVALHGDVDERLHEPSVEDSVRVNVGTVLSLDVRDSERKLLRVLLGDSDPPELV
jgi:hypothetical protein